MSEKKRLLKDGTNGSRMVEYFEKEHQRVAVDAEIQGEFNLEELTCNYRMTFDDGSVEDWKFYYPGRYSFTITWGEMYNKVI